MSAFKLNAALARLTSFTAPDFIYFGNTSPFTGCEQDVLDYIVSNGLIDSQFETALIGLLRAGDRHFECLFVDGTLISVRMISIVRDEVDEVMASLPNGHIYGLPIVTAASDDWGSFASLNNEVSVLCSEGIIKIIGFDIYHAKELLFQIQYHQDP